MGQALRAAIAAYKKSKHEAKEKSRLLRKDLDYNYIQKLLNAMAEDQQRIGIDIVLTNGTVIKFRKEGNNSYPLKDPYIEGLR